MDKDKNERISELKEYLLKAESRVKYSLERFDILIISLSSGGLILALNVYEKFKNQNIDKDLVTTAWMFFSISLMVNLLSQVTGYLANKYDIRVTRIIIKEIESREVQESQKTLQCYQDISDFFTKWLNIISFFSLVIGITLLIIFMNFKI